MCDGILGHEPEDFGDAYGEDSLAWTQQVNGRRYFGKFGNRGCYHLREFSRWESEKRDEDIRSSLQGPLERTVPKGIPETSGMRTKVCQSLNFSKLYCFSLLQLYSKSYRLYK